MTTATAPLEAPPRVANAFRIDRDGDLATVWFDLPGEKVNKFSSAVMTEFAAVVDELERAADIKRVVVA
jgi:enoyl-CoA hydratase/carnithine racemase